MYFYEKEPVSLYLSNLEEIETINSKKQCISFFIHPWLGRILEINGEIQHVEAYQSLYHEMLVHFPVSFIPKVSTVLILGGGSLFAAYEALKYSTVEEVVLCDYDHSVIELMAKYYEHAKTVLNDKRFKYIEMDANIYIKTNKKRFDLIINDCFNLSERSNASQLSYYRLLNHLCTPCGVCVDIIYRHIFDKQTTIDSLNYLRQERNTVLSLVCVPEYPGILHIETLWGKSNYLSQKSKSVINDFQKHNQSLALEFYNPNYLPYYLYLPPYIKEKFNL